MDEKNNPQIPVPENVPETETPAEVKKEEAAAPEAVPAKTPFHKKKGFKIAVIAAAVVIVVIVIAIFLLGRPDPAIKEARDMGQEAFAKTCEEYEFKDLQRDPDSYSGQPVKMTVRIDTEFEENAFDSYTGDLGEDPENWYEDNLVLMNYSDTNLVDGDIMTVYGVYGGLIEIETVLGQNLEVPCMNAVFVEESDHEAVIEEIMQTVKFKKTSDEYGFRDYEAKVKNTTDITFDNFSIEVEYLDSKGEVTGTDSAYAENWGPGETAIFELTLIDEKPAKIKIKDWDYY